MKGGCRARRSERGLLLQVSELQRCHAPAFHASLRVGPKCGPRFAAHDSEGNDPSEPHSSRGHPHFGPTHLTFVVGTGPGIGTCAQKARLLRSRKLSAKLPRKSSSVSATLLLAGVTRLRQIVPSSSGTSGRIGVRVDLVARVDEEVGLEATHRLVHPIAAARLVDAPALAGLVAGERERHVARPRRGRADTARHRRADLLRTAQALEAHANDRRSGRARVRAVRCAP